MTDTIYAPSSAIGGAIAVIRISGPEAGRAGELFHRDFTKQPGMLRHGRLMDGDRLVDDCMAVFFPGPGSYTGEDMVEINCHGGIVTVRQILSLLSRLGFRPAGPGEFTRRAFENGKMDLSQAEAVMDVVAAGAERSLQAALRQLSGSVKSAVTDMEEGLMDALSGIDAAIDYPDEAEEDTVEHLPEALSRVKSLLEETILEGRRGRVLRDGIQVVILGQPNVGKSSFINRMSKGGKAKVEDRAGVTRHNQWYVIGDGLELLDTPGILWPRFDSQTVGENLAFTGAIRDEIMDRETLAANLFLRLREHYAESIERRYKFAPTPEMSGMEILEIAAKKRGFLLPGGVYDTERMACVLLDEFRGGVLGRISLERPEAEA